MTAADRPKLDCGRDAPGIQRGFQLAGIHHAGDYVRILQSLGWQRARHSFTGYMFLSPSRVLRATQP